MAYIIIMWGLLVILPPESIIDLALEDGVFESFGALYFFMSAFIFLVSFVQSKAGSSFMSWNSRRNYVYLLLALVFFFGAGEEISWGQRVFNFKTPDSFIEVNKQKEFNFHNLGLDFAKLYNVFWLGFLIVVPLASKYVPRLGNWLKSLGMPIVPLELGSLVFLDYLIFRLILFVGFKDDEIYGGGLTEMYENETAFHFFLISVACYISVRRMNKNWLPAHHAKSTGMS